MNSLDRKKKEVDLKKIDAAVAELEYKIIEREEDIQRMKDHIDLQLERKKEIQKELANS